MVRRIAEEIVAHDHRARRRRPPRAPAARGAHGRRRRRPPARDPGLLPRGPGVPPGGGARRARRARHRRPARPQVGRRRPAPRRDTGSTSTPACSPAATGCWPGSRACPRPSSTASSTGSATSRRSCGPPSTTSTTSRASARPGPGPSRKACPAWPRRRSSTATPERPGTRRAPSRRGSTPAGSRSSPDQPGNPCGVEVRWFAVDLVATIPSRTRAPLGAARLPGSASAISSLDEILDWYARRRPVPLRDQRCRLLAAVVDHGGVERRADRSPPRSLVRAGPRRRRRGRAGRRRPTADPVRRLLLAGHEVTRSVAAAPRRAGRLRRRRPACSASSPRSTDDPQAPACSSSRTASGTSPTRRRHRRPEAAACRPALIGDSDRSPPRRRVRRARHARHPRRSSHRNLMRAGLEPVHTADGPRGLTDPVDVRRTLRPWGSMPCRGRCSSLPRRRWPPSPTTCGGASFGSTRSPRRRRPDLCDRLPGDGPPRRRPSPPSLLPDRRRRAPVRAIPPSSPKDGSASDGRCVIPRCPAPTTRSCASGRGARSSTTTPAGRRRHGRGSGVTGWWRRHGTTRSSSSTSNGRHRPLARRRTGGYSGRPFAVAHRDLIRRARLRRCARRCPPARRSRSPVPHGTRRHAVWWSRPTSAGCGRSSTTWWPGSPAEHGWAVAAVEPFPRPGPPASRSAWPRSADAARRPTGRRPRGGRRPARRRAGRHPRLLHGRHGHDEGGGHAPLPPGRAVLRHDPQPGGVAQRRRTATPSTRCVDARRGRAGAGHHRHRRPVHAAGARRRARGRRRHRRPLRGRRARLRARPRPPRPPRRRRRRRLAAGSFDWLSGRGSRAAGGW